MSKKISKLMKIFGGLFTLCAPILSIVCLTSCNNNDCEKMDINEHHIKYIKDRSFSLVSSSMYQTMWGTGWILNKMNNQEEYSYYVATNLHVSHPMFFENVTGWKYYIGDNYSDTNESFNVFDPNYYTELKNIDDDKNPFMAITCKKEFLSFDSNPNNSIDFEILEVNFANAINENEHLKQKLDNLNTYYNEHGYINKFSNNSKQEKTGYCAGFPASSGYKTKFVGEKINNLAVVKNDDEWYHPCATKSDDQKTDIYDASWNYLGKRVHDDEFQLDGGSSGSMLIDENYEVIGIYWGGWLYEQLPDFQPSFSMFYTTSYNYLSNLI